MRRTFLIVLVLLASCSSASTASIDAVAALEARDLVADPATVTLDIRTPDEFAEGHIEGAINIDFYAPDFADRIGALDREARYVVYCRSDNRSGQSMELFRTLGFTEVHEVDGGILAWLEEGLPVVSPG